jgi:hypothetical protein
MTAPSAASAITSTTTSATAAVAGHLIEARVNLLLGLNEHVHEVTGLLGICERQHNTLKCLETHYPW